MSYCSDLFVLWQCEKFVVFRVENVVKSIAEVSDWCYWCLGLCFFGNLLLCEM